MSDKSSLRAEKLAQRKALDAKTAAQAAQTVAAHLLHLVPVGAAVALYRAIRGEIDVSQALVALSARGNSVCLPVVTDNKELLFRLWDPTHTLAKGAYNIDEPHETAEIIEPDMVIVPLVAFDKAGHRLGYGAGHYDATIRSLRKRKKSVQIVGAAYDMQQVDSISAEEHDERLDAVVTEKGIMGFK